MESSLLNFSQSTGIYGFMNTPWGWPIIESLHFVGLSLLIGCVGIFDLRMLGYARGVSMSALHKLVPFGVLGYGVNVVTGTMFITSAPDQYIYNPAFQIKILFMSLAGINMFYFYQICFSQIKAAEPNAQATRQARVIAAISLLCWVGVISGGRLITFFRPPYFWCIWCS